MEFVRADNFEAAAEFLMSKEGANHRRKVC
jgi:hypothetical protein